MLLVHSHLLLGREQFRDDNAFCGGMEAMGCSEACSAGGAEHVARERKSIRAEEAAGQEEAPHPALPSMDTKLYGTSPTPPTSRETVSTVDRADSFGTFRSYLGR